MRAGRQDVDLYGTLVEKLGQYGEVLTPFVADKSITHLGMKVDFISWTTKLMVTFVGGVEGWCYYLQIIVLLLPNIFE